MISIIHESEEHHDAVKRVTQAAFAASELGHNGESELIEAIRVNTENILSMVAIDEKKVVGHILFSPAWIENSERKIIGMGLAPMSVTPEYQRQGIGSLLVKTAFQHLATFKSVFTVVAGHPDFYSRFGFQLASEFGLKHGFAGMPQDILLVRSNDSNLLQEFGGGLVFYHSEFGTQHDMG